MIPDVRRAVSICWECGELGINAQHRSEDAAKLKKIGQHRRIIPTEVLQVFQEGKPWYELEFNNELEKLLRTAKVQDLVQFIQGVSAVAALYPDIIHAIDWYQLLDALNDNLDIDAKIMVSANDFKNVIAEAAKQKQQMMQLQGAQAAASAAKDGASAQQANAQAGAIKNGQTQQAGIPGL